MNDPLDTPAAIKLGLDLAADFARQTPDDRDDRIVALCRKVLTEPAAEVLIDKIGSALPMDAAKLWEQVQEFLDAHPDIATPLKDAEKRLLKLALDYALEKITEATGK